MQRIGRYLNRIDTYPITLGVAWVIGYWGLSGAPLEYLFRPVAFAVLITLTVVVGTAFVAPSRHWVRLGIGIAMIMALGAWAFLAALAVIAGWRLAVSLLRRFRGRPAIKQSSARHITRLANAVGLSIAVVMILTVLGPEVSRPSAAIAAESSTLTTNQESVYLILLDGYPRADTLLEEFNVDSGPFFSELEARGFSVATKSRSNYTKTQMTLTSMFNMRYVSEIPGLTTTGDAAAEARIIHRAINSPNNAFGVFARHGFHTVSVSSPFGEVALSMTDEVRETGALTHFEEMLIRNSGVAYAMPGVVRGFAAGQQRASVESTLEAAADIAVDREDRPVLAFVHVMSPHTPFVFHHDGAPRELPGCYPRECGLWHAPMHELGLTMDEYSEGLAGQVRWLNDRLLATVDRIRAADPRAAIILFSDHGARHGGFGDEEAFRSFFAAATPTVDVDFGDHISPVNVFPLLLNEMFSMDVDTHPYQAWWSDALPLNLIPVGD